MPIRIGLEELRRRLQAAGAYWEAGVTAQSDHSEAQARNRLGYVPGPSEPSLREAEQRARAAVTRPTEPQATRSHDWRNVNGNDFVTPIEDQGGCGSCVAFGAVAAVESLVRITRNAPTKAVDLSEAHLFFCYGPNTGAGRCPEGGWWPEAAYESLKTGVVDAACFPYSANDQPCNLCANWQSRLTKISGWHKPTNAAEMKAFLSTVGPMTACFTVYEDFYYHYERGVYTHVSGEEVGGHCVCIVGYDDAQGCWIAKNQWGLEWGEAGYFRIAYGQCGIDSEMWAPEGIVHSAWAELYSDANTLAMLDVAPNADGRLEVFGVNAQQRIFHTWQTQPNGGWIGSWSELYSDTNTLASLRLAANADGRLEVFGVNAQGRIFHTWQTQPNGGWVGSWSELYSDANMLVMLDVAPNADGRLEVFGVNAQGRIFHTWQTKPNGGWVGSWSELYSDANTLRSLRVAANAEGRLAVFGVNAQGRIFHTWQTQPGGWIGSWSELYSDANTLAMLDVAPNADGRLEVFGVNAQGRIFHTWQTQPNGGWVGSWSELYSDANTLRSLRVAPNADGRLEVFGVNAQGRIFHTWQTQPNGGWVGSWSELYTDADTLAMLDIARNADGRLEVFGVDQQGHIRHTWETQPNNGWVG